MNNHSNPSPLRLSVLLAWLGMILFAGIARSVDSPLATGQVWFSDSEDSFGNTLRLSSDTEPSGSGRAARFAACWDDQLAIPTIQYIVPPDQSTDRQIQVTGGPQSGPFRGTNAAASGPRRLPEPDRQFAANTATARSTSEVPSQPSSRNDDPMAVLGSGRAAQSIPSMLS